MIRSKGIDHAHTPWALTLHRDFAARWEDTKNLFDFSFLYQKFNNYQNPVVLLTSEERLIYSTSAQAIHDRERYEKFKNWQHVVTAATTIEQAFPRGQNEELGDYQNRVGRDKPAGAEGRRSDLKKKQHQATGSFIERIKEAAKSAIIGPS